MAAVAEQFAFGTYLERQQQPETYHSYLQSTERRSSVDLRLNVSSDL